MSIPRVATFLLVVGGLVASIHYYFWARLVRDPALPPALSAVLTALVVVAGVGLFAGAAGSRFLPRRVAAVLSWVVFAWLGTMFYLLVLLGVGDLVRAIVAAVSGAPLDPVPAARLLGVSATGAAAILALVAVYQGLRRVGVRRVRVPLARLPESLRGFSIVQISDVHVGATIGDRFIEDIVARVNSLEPDIVAITGDLVDGSVASLAPHVAPLAKLRAKDGVFFVTGNHEAYSGVRAWTEHLAGLGIRVLRDERVELARGIDVAGIDDPTVRRHDDREALARALDGRDESRAVVLLAHQPKAIHAASAAKVDLTLSGHTHGGQIFPFHFLVRLQQPYLAGLHLHDGARLYVSRGTGYWGPPMRLAAPAEITRLELVPEG